MVEQRKPLMTVLTIVEEYLGAHGYDGLFNVKEGVPPFNDDGYNTCSCELRDLYPCGAINGNCQPGYKVPCNCGDHDWHIDIRRVCSADLLEEVLPKDLLGEECLPKALLGEEICRPGKE
jgi:hypothetical protein